MSSSEVRSIRLAVAAAAALREETFDGRPHLVVPVVALVGDSVVRPMGSSGPEYVPAAELSFAPAGWNGRPVVPDHPTTGGRRPISANSPEVLEAERIGVLFNTRFEAGRLKTEAWLDLTRAAEGQPGYEIVSKIRSGEMIEVSVGCLVFAEPRAGRTPDGTSYEFIWHDIIPDHLAIGLSGAKGACSIADGCGAPRAAKEENTMAQGQGGLWSRVIGQIKAILKPLESVATGESDVDLRDRLWSALNSTVPAFGGIEGVYPDSNTVIYATAGEEFAYWSRTFSVAEDGAVTLGEDEQQVEPALEWKAVEKAAEAIEQPQPGCGCSEGVAEGERHAASAQVQEENNSMTSEKQKALAGRLIACSKSPFAEPDRAALEAFPEERLVALAEAFADAPAPVTETAPAGATEPEKPKTEEELIAALPEGLRHALNRLKEADAERHTSLVASLKSAQDALTEDQLKAKPVEELEVLARMLKLATPSVDFAGRTLPTPRSAEIVEPPKPYTEALKALASKAN